MPKKDFNIVELANNDACFDLQFRKDTRHERTNSPTYYRWKLQFVITGPRESVKIMQKVKKEMGYGDVYSTSGQARFSIQKIDDLHDGVVPYFTKNKLSANKKRDFELWKKAVEIIYKNKGIYLTKWAKNDLKHLIEIHKTRAKYKQNPRSAKWMEMAQNFAKTPT